jgi:mRNA interferase MazF
MALRRGEIYFVDLNPVKGHEQAGIRPVPVLSIDYINSLPLVATVVIGTKGANVPKEFRTTVRVPAAESGLREETVFLGFQMRSLDQKRFPAHPVGRLAAAYLKKVEDAVRYCLGLP